MESLLNAVALLSVDEKQLLVSQLSFETNKKPNTTFSNPKLSSKDLSRLDGLGLDLKNVGNRLPSLHLPISVTLSNPTDWLCNSLDKINRVWELKTEQACRIIIDAILTEVLSESDLNLTGFCEVPNDWTGSGFGYKGYLDYAFGSSKFIDDMDTLIMVLESKRDWPSTAVYQVLAEAGCFLKRRLEQDKMTPVFAVLSNGDFFRFFAIDEKSVVFCSKLIALSVPDDGDWKNSKSLVEILTWFNWFITCMAVFSPRVSRVTLTDTHKESLQSEIRECFGVYKF